MDKSKINSIESLHCVYLTGDSEVTIFLTYKEEKNHKFEKTKKYIRRCVLGAISFILSSITIYPLAVSIIQTVDLERGYKAYGGEYILLLYIWVALFYLIWRAIGKSEK